MADIAIFRINYKSDFILTLQSDAGWTTPFCVKFWTGAPSKAYYAYYDGMSYTHCTPVEGEPTKLLVQFDDHHLPIGDLKFQIGYHFTVADFPTSVEDEVINQASVIIEVDDAPAQVMLDFNGETAPEIQFALPAYVNEAQRIANEQARIAAEEQRISNEEVRIAAEETRQQNEQQRISREQQRIEQEQQRVNAEAERVSEFASLKTESETATAAANIAATLANEKAQLADDKAALAQAAATLANEKAQLAEDKANLAQQKADYAQTQGNYAKAQGDAAKTEAEAAHSLNEEVSHDEATRQQQEAARQQAEAQRVIDFNAQMQQQQTAYTNAEAARDTAFDEAETERDAKVDAKVADITNLQAQLGYFVCDTGAAVAAKTIAATGYALTTGGNIRIKMTNANTADAVTLNINSTGTKALFYNGAQASAENSWKEGEVLEVYYDGTQYQGVNIEDAKNVTYNNTNSGVDASNLQDGIDKVANAIMLNEEVTIVADNSAFTGGGYIDANNTVKSSSNSKYIHDFPIGDYDNIAFSYYNGGGYFTVLTDSNHNIIRAFHPTADTVIYPKEIGAAYLSHCVDGGAASAIFTTTKNFSIERPLLDKIKENEQEIEGKYVTEDEEIDVSDNLSFGYINSQGSLVVQESGKNMVVYLLDISSYDSVRIYAPFRLALYDSKMRIVAIHGSKPFFDIDIKNTNVRYVSYCYETRHDCKCCSLKKTDERKIIVNGGRTGILKADGKVDKSFSQYVLQVSEPYEVNEGEKYRVHCYGVDLERVAILFDSNYNVLSSYRAGYGQWLNIEVPQEGKYVIFASASSYFDVYDCTNIKTLSQNGIVNAYGSWQALGTSITWFDVAPNFAGGGAITQGYPSWVQKNLSFNDFTNSAVNGGTVESAINKVIVADYYTIEHGINDCGRVPLGTLDDYINNADNGTFAANYRKLVDSIYTANPLAVIIVCTPMFSTTKTYSTLVDYVSMVKSIAQYEGFPIADFFYDANINTHNISNLSIDNLHPNDGGHKRLASVLLSAFKKAIVR